MNDIKILKDYYFLTKNKDVQKTIKDSIKEEEKIKKRKSRHEEIELVEEYMVNNNEISVIEEININEKLERIRLILEKCKFTKEEKEILKYYKENESIKAIAHELNKSISYVYKKKEQIINKLREEYCLSFPLEYKEEVM